MAAPVQVGISTGGKFFFGGLTAGTFGLGCWQLHRLQAKMGMIEDRENQLAMEPSREVSASSDDSPYRRRLLEGTFRHDKEVLVGPRGAPPGVSLPRKGLSAKSSTNAPAGMAPGPQGFHVLTPLELSKEWQGTRKVVWVNRGWVPKTFIPGSDGRRKESSEAPTEWDRPKGPVKVTTIRSSPEIPKLITPEHDYSKRPLQLFWLDGLALQAIAESDEETMYLLQVQDSEKDKTVYPLKPPVESVAEFKTTTMIHAGYAVTWYGLSAAGVYMTRMLITRGRG